MIKRLLLCILLIALAWLLVSCGTRVRAVEIEKLRTEYQDRLRLERDSIYLHDSIYIIQRGDTVYRDRWHTRYREVVRHDTAYIERRDSIAYPVVVEVEKPRHWLHKLELNLYRVVCILLLLAVGWRQIRSILWQRRL